MKQLPLSQGLFAIVDDEDYEELNKFKWYAAKCRNTFYAQRRDIKTNKTIYMHRVILNIIDNKIKIDHKNRSGLDNQKDNLRTCTNSQNIRNSESRQGTSKYKGVSWDKQSNKWRPRIHVHGKSLSFGLFNSQKDAAKAYDLMAEKLFGEFAFLNIKD